MKTSNGESEEEDVQSSLQPSIRMFLILFSGSAIVALGLSWLLLDESLKGIVSEWLVNWTSQPFNYSLIVIGVLASDLLLPIPSSVVLTHAGGNLGVVWGTLVGFIGLTSGSLIGFGLARRFGQAYIARRINPTDRDGLSRMTERFGVFAIILLRPIPILAEASVLLLAAGQMPWKPFLVWLSISNLFVAFFFVAFGRWADDYGIGEIASLLIAAAIPILLLICVRVFFHHRFRLES